MKYLIIVESSESGYSAKLPDLPGCVATGASLSEAEINMKEAVEFHIAGLKTEGCDIPLPTCRSAYVELAA